MRRLCQDPAYLNSFLEVYPEETEPRSEALKRFWSRFVELSRLDPYTAERTKLVRQYSSETWCRHWVESALEVCKLHDSEFSLVLQEEMENRFELAAALLGQEGVLPLPSLEE